MDLVNFHRFETLFFTHHYYLFQNSSPQKISFTKHFVREYLRANTTKTCAIKSCATYHKSVIKSVIMTKQGHIIAALSKHAHQVTYTVYICERMFYI